MTGSFLANMFLVMMIGEVNRKRPDGNLVSYFGFSHFKVARIFREYRKSYPAGKTHIYALIAFAMALAGLVGVAVCLRIIGG
jgi:glutamate mutase epsilon subunit